jgi:hydroxypyruvate isomerase
MLDRPDWAQRCGFDGVEMLFPYDHPMSRLGARAERPAAGADQHAPRRLGQRRPRLCRRSGDGTAFRDSFLRGAEYATRLRAARLHVMAGVAKGPQAEQCYVENLTWALAAGTGPDALPGTAEPRRHAGLFPERL